ncbi:FAD dependent oxidoreductase [Xylariomycetidae sp. FL2044]|nr:FAD dependent oxidoreductase [Xylariomycetidae sp. FL2044]
MGAVQSQLKTLWLAVKVLLELNKDLQPVLERASASPGLPVPNPTASYWLADPPHPELVDAQSPVLPSSSEIVIIGSGITGAAIARTVLHERQRKASYSSSTTTATDPHIVVLESRSLCSGATGRNGGHIKSSPHELFARLRKTFGPARAAALTRFQLRHVGVLTELCRAEGWELAECREVETADLYLDEADREKAFEEVRELAKWIPELEVRMLDEVEAQKTFKVNSYIKGAISYTAGALWPYRLVSCAWKDLLSRFEKSLSIETGTSALSIKTLQHDPDFAYEVATTRGTIKCNHVVHATNAFATEFVPGLRGKMAGMLAHMSAQRPGKSFPETDGSRSWSVVYGSGFDYITQRPPTTTTTTTTGDGSKAAGDIMLGGGFTLSANGGMSSVGVWDDSRMDALPAAHNSGIFPTVFAPRWGDEGQGGRTKQSWSGIVAATGDLLPFVGRLDPKLTGRRRPGPRKGDDRSSSSKAQPGEWVSAGYCGDGMVWAWLSGTAVGMMLAGAEDEDVTKPIPGHPGGRMTDWFPQDLRPSLDRVKRADLSGLMEYFL